MHHVSRRRRLVLIGAVLAASALLVAACSSSKKDSDSASTTTAGSATNAQTVKFDKTIQQQLADVGCYSGAIDGILGPETDAAILAFQEAAGLSADGELGPETQSALASDATAKKKVCETTSTTGKTTTTTASGGSAPCTATAIQTALPSGVKITAYVCSDGYAGVTGTQSSAAYHSVLQANGATWKDLGEEPCGSASAGIAPQVLEVGCAT